MSPEDTTSRPTEIEALFNPSLLSILATRFVEGHVTEHGSDPVLPIVYVGVAIALDSTTRDTLTMTIRSNLGAWKYENSRAVTHVPHICRLHAGNISRAIIFGLNRQILSIQDAQLGLGPNRLRKSLSGFSEEVTSSQQAAYYLGRWFSTSGSPATVLSLLGVRP